MEEYLNVPLKGGRGRAVTGPEFVRIVGQRPGIPED